MEVTVPVWDHDKCVAAFTENIFNETLCAGGLEGGKDACQVILLFVMLGNGALRKSINKSVQKVEGESMW